MKSVVTSMGFDIDRARALYEDRAAVVLSRDGSLGSAKVIEAAAGIVTWFAEARLHLLTRPCPV